MGKCALANLHQGVFPLRSGNQAIRCKSSCRYAAPLRAFRYYPSRNIVHHIVFVILSEVLVAKDLQSALRDDTLQGK